MSQGLSVAWPAQTHELFWQKKIDDSPCNFFDHQHKFIILNLILVTRKLEVSSEVRTLSHFTLSPSE